MRSGVWRFEEVIYLRSGFSSWFVQFGRYSLSRRRFFFQPLQPFQLLFTQVRIQFASLKQSISNLANAYEKHLH